MREVTDIQRETMECIHDLRAEYGIAPTFRELAAHLGIHIFAVWRRLQGLRKKGCVTWQERKMRTIRLTETGKRVLEAARRAGV